MDGLRGWKIAGSAMMAIVVLSAGCAQSTEFSGEVPAPTAAGGSGGAATPTRSASGVTTGPAWYRHGLASADAELATARTVTPRSASTAPGATAKAAASTGLPPKDTFVAGLTSLGLSPKIADCMYTSITNAGTGSDAAKLVNLLAASTGSKTSGAKTTGSKTTNDGATALAALQGLDQASVLRFVVSVAPCIDSATLLSLFTRSGTATPSAAGAGGLTSLLGGLSSINLGKIDPSAVTGLVSSLGASLNTGQLASVAGVLAGAAKGQFGGLDLATVDLSKLDLTKLSSDQVVLLFAVLLKGLTTDQQGQLQQLANVNLAKLGIAIDPSKLSPEQYGPLVLLLLPYFGAAINLAAGNQAPQGADPNQLYVPASLDLSQINPLFFVSRAALVAALGTQGVSPAFASCIYDHLRALDPRLIGVALDGSNLAATGQLLLSVLSCIVS